MRDESRAIAVRQNGEVQKFNAEKTKAIWASAGADVKSPEVAKALALIGDRYELDPALGEVMILGSKVYITAEGYLRIAEQQPAYDGYELNPMTEQERKDAKVGADEFAYVAKVYRKDRRFPSVGYGVASDASISMGPMKMYKREVAQKRALHRALRMAFRAGIPDYEDAIQAIEEYQPVVGQIAAPADVPPAPAAPDWRSFWTHMKGIGASDEEVHKVLNVESVKDWAGTMEDAISEVERFVLQRDRVPAPAAPIAPARRPLSDDEINDGYDKLVEKAIFLGLPYKSRLGNWPRSQTIEEGTGLRNRIRVAEEEGAAKG